MFMRRPQLKDAIDLNSKISITCPTAQEAMEQTKKVRLKKIEQDKKKIFNWISTAIERGEYSITFSGMYIEAVNYFSTLGFEINQWGGLTTISWLPEELKEIKEIGIIDAIKRSDQED